MAAIQIKVTNINHYEFSDIESDNLKNEYLYLNITQHSHLILIKEVFVNNKK